MGTEDLLAETVALRGHGGAEIPAYLARTTEPGSHPGVVVVHHKHGCDWTTRETVRRFAAAGFAAIMPDLHHHIAPGRPAVEAAALVEAAGGVPDDQCVGDLAGALGFLRGQPFCTGRVGVVGYCSGGRQAYLASARLGFDATVVCYGGRIVAGPEDLNERTPVAPIELTAAVAGPVLSLSGVEDRRPSPADTARLRAELERHGKVHRIVEYENAGHAFFSVDRPHYRPEAAMRGWAEILSWFHQHLEGRTS